MNLRDLNRRLLWSHCLSRNMAGRRAVVKVADACCGIQSQSFQESLSSFWARTEDFEDSRVLAELRPGGGLVRTLAIRSVRHTIPSRDFYTYVLGGGSERLLNWLDSIAKKRQYPPREERKRIFYDPILKEMNGKSLTEEEIRHLTDGIARRRGLKEKAWSGIGDMAFLGSIVIAGKRGRGSLWMRSEDWIPGLDPAPDFESCRTRLVRQYIAHHGPVSKEDIQYWAYLSKGQLDKVLTALVDELVEVKIEGSGQKYLALNQKTDHEYPPPQTVILLPRYDSLLLSLRDKSRFMDMKHYKRLFPPIPVGMVEATVLLDGFVAATWRRIKEKTSSFFNVRPVRKILKKDQEAVEDKFLEYSEYLGVNASVRWST